MPTEDYSRMPADTSRDNQGRLTTLTAPRIERDPKTLEPINIPERSREPNTSFHSPNFTEKQMQELRETWIKHGGSAEAFDKAAIQDGHKPAAPPDPAIVKAHDQAGVPLTPLAEDYRPDWNSTRDLKNISENFKDLQNVTKITTQWAADLGLNKELGRSIIERIAEIGSATSRMSPEEKATWVDRQGSSLKKIAGNVTEAATMRQQAEAFLGSHEFSKILKGSLAMHDPFILSALATSYKLADHLKKTGAKK